MEFNPDSHVRNLAALVVNEKDPLFGKIGSVEDHDWRESGTYLLRFDGEPKIYHDGLCKGDAPSKVRIYYRQKNEKGDDFDVKGKGPNSLILDFVNFGFGDEKKFLEMYKNTFNEDF